MVSDRGNALLGCALFAGVRDALVDRLATGETGSGVVPESDFGLAQLPAQ